jgi:hypothetical protein
MKLKSMDFLSAASGSIHGESRMMSGPAYRVLLLQSLTQRHKLARMIDHGRRWRQIRFCSLPFQRACAWRAGCRRRLSARRPARWRTALVVGRYDDHVVTLVYRRCGAVRGHGERAVAQVNRKRQGGDGGWTQVGGLLERTRVSCLSLCVETSGLRPQAGLNSLLSSTSMKSERRPSHDILSKAKSGMSS